MLFLKFCLNVICFFVNLNIHKVNFWGTSCKRILIMQIQIHKLKGVSNNVKWNLKFSSIMLKNLLPPSDLKDQLSTLPTKSEEPFSDREKTLTYLIIDMWKDISFKQFGLTHMFVSSFSVCLIFLLYWPCWDMRRDVSHHSLNGEATILLQILN